MNLISDHVPPLLLLNLAQGLTEEEKEELEKLKASTPKDTTEAEETKSKIEELYKKRQAPNEALGFSGWIPIPLLGSEFIPILPDAYSSTVVKRVETIGSDVVMSSTMSTQTINIKTGSGDIINAIVNACQYLYSLDDSFARIAFFSPEMVIVNGMFLSMTRSVTLGQTEEQIISIQVQTGTPKYDIAKQLLSKKPSSTEVIKATGEVVQSA